MSDAAGQVTELLAAVQRGDAAAKSQLATLVYAELHQMARRLMSRERPDHTLQATALVHEAYLRLADRDKTWQNRGHFYAVAARVMRGILIDYARAHRSSKRGGAQQRVDLDAVPMLTEAHFDKLLALDEALSRLTEWDRRQSQVVELRFFGGLDEAEIADVLGISVRTVKRDWHMARAWLYAEIGP